MHVKGKVALVTGASQGIGRALSVELARRGAWVVLAGLHQEELCKLQAQITGGGGRAIALPCNVREEALVRWEGKIGVYVLEQDVVRFREVSPGEARAGRVAVAAGLEGGERIVADPPIRLRDGDRVRVEGE